MRLNRIRMTKESVRVSSASWSQPNSERFFAWTPQRQLLCFPLRVFLHSLDSCGANRCLCWGLQPLQG